jgi:CheY-like chemotaxis protein
MKSILFAEDSEDDVFLLQRACRRGQLANPLTFVKDGREAINYLSEAEALPGCVVLDVKMPYRSGLEVLDWIRRQSKMNGLTVMMMTSSAQDQDIREAYRLGADAYLVKPSGSDQLDKLVQELKTTLSAPRGDPAWQALACNRPPPLSRPDKPL